MPNLLVIADTKSSDTIGHIGHNRTQSGTSGTFICILTNVFVLFAAAHACYFPIEYQGTFLIQTQASRTESSTLVTYSEVTVEADAIPPWGRCHKRRGNNVILKDSTGAQDCLRCFHLTMKTPNVIQLHTDGLERCYTNEEAARATCPSDKDIAKKKFKEMILFRKCRRHRPYRMDISSQRRGGMQRYSKNLVSGMFEGANQIKQWPYL